MGRWKDIVAAEPFIRQAAQLLMQHLALFSGVEAIVPEEQPVIEEEEPSSSYMYDTPIEELDLTVRVYNCLKRTGVTKVGEVLEKMAKGTDEMLAIRNFGMKSLVELNNRLVEKGFLAEGEFEF